MIKAKRTGGRTTRKSASATALRLVKAPQGERRPDPTEGRVLVPMVDGSGAPLPSWRVARWHLFAAARLLREEYLRHRADGCADDHARAAAVALQVWASLHPGAAEPDRSSLQRMARECEVKVKAHKSDAEARLLEVLPHTRQEARVKFDAGGDGSRNLAHLALGCLVAHDHADAGKVLKRWGAAAFGSPQFAEDVEELASEIRGLMLDPGSYARETFAHGIVRRMYQLVGLRHPFEAKKKKASRLRNARRPLT